MLRLILTVLCVLAGVAQAEPVRVGILGAPNPPAFGQAQTETEHLIAPRLWSGLTRLDAQGDPQPDLAAYWDVSQDRLVYRFQLKDNLRWSDGSALTPQQFLESLSGLPLMSVATDPSGAVTLTLTRPRADLLRLLARPDLGPRPPRPGLYSGPFVVGERAEGRLDLTPNPYHPAPGAGPVELVTVETFEDAERRFVSGALHIAPVERSEPSSRSTGQRITAVSVNYQAADVGGVAGLDVRHALSMSVDREFLLESLALPGFSPQTTPLPPGLLLGGSFPVPFEGLSYPDRDGVAEALLAVAGYEADSPLQVTLLVPAGERLDQTAQWLAREWREIGVQVNLDPVGLSEFEQRLARGTFQLALRDIAPKPADAAAQLAVFLQEAGPQNIGRYQVNEFESAYLQAETADDPAVRRRRHRNSEKELIEDQIRISLYRSNAHWLVSERVEGWPETPAGLPPLESLWLAP